VPSPLSIVFCGTPDFAVPSLRALANDPAFKIELVITQPDKPVGRKQILTPPPVKVFANEQRLTCIQPQNINNEDIRHKLETISFQYLVTVAFGQIFSKEILALPSIAPINIHASLLPRWRGASPIQHALLSGDNKTGVTIQRMVEKLDAGPILAQKKRTIDERETAETLFQKLAEDGAQLLIETLKSTLKETEQVEADATLCRKLSRDDGIIDPKVMTAQEIDRKVRALTPWPGVTCPIDGEMVKILTTSLQEAADSMPLPCSGNSTLFINNLQAPGRKPVSGTEWLRGRKNT